MQQIKDSYRKLLSSYSDYVRRMGHLEAATIALRTRSSAMRDVIAYIASYNNHTLSELENLLDHNKLVDGDFRYEWLAALGRVTALQAFQARSMSDYERDVRIGLKLLQLSNPMISADKEHLHFHRLEAELLMREGDLEAAKQKIQSISLLDETYYGYLLSDLHNPVLSKDKQTYDRWLTSFNRPFTENGLKPVVSIHSKAHSFNDLAAPTIKAECEEDTPLVSVIMTSYKPQQNDFLHAVDSILDQTWPNLELIIVDDASPDEFSELLRLAAARDQRVKLVVSPQNGGTYRARNIGIEHARGTYITGQDSDDWSHPERLEHQVNHLMSHPSSSGVVVEAIRMNNDLIRTFPGRMPERLCEVSLMIRSDFARKVGGYIDARKGADSEFRRRIERISKRKVDVVKKPLYLTRIGHESLSAADFKPGWSHPVRRAFWNASHYWHENAEEAELLIDSDSRQPIPVPDKFMIHPHNGKSHMDVLFVHDWRTYGASQRAALDEISALKQRGQRVGILHLESLLSSSKEPTRLSDEVQKLINRGEIREVVLDEKVQADLVIVSDPTILQFVPVQRSTIDTCQVLIIGEVPPVIGTAQEKFLYLPDHCSAVAEELFGGESVWSSRDAKIHQQLMIRYPAINIHPNLIPVMLRNENWSNSRPRLQNDIPIIGRHSENFEELWPSDFDALLKVWPSDGRREVRVLGDARGLLRKHNRNHYPASWIVFRDREVRPEAFMSGIDFFVYFPEAGLNQSFCREALEAVASGALAILPKEYEQAHGDTAIYATAEEIEDIITKFLTNEQLFHDAVEQKRQQLVQSFQDLPYVNFIGLLTAQNVSKSTKDSSSTCELVRK